MQQNNNFNQTRTPNKGFNLHLVGSDGETYIGHLVISEKNSSDNMVKQLQDPANMKAMIAACELRPFTDRKEQDSTDADAIFASVQTAKAE